MLFRSGWPSLEITEVKAGAETGARSRQHQHADILGSSQAREMALQRQQVLDMQSVVLCRAIQRDRGAAGVDLQQRATGIFVGHRWWDSLGTH